MQRADASGAAVLSSLLGEVGLVPIPTSVVTPLSAHAVVLIHVTT